MAASGRVRRSVRFAYLDPQEGPAGQGQNMRRERITVSDRLEMPSFQNTQDWTGGMGISPSGRFRVVEEARPKQKVISESGIRKDVARLAMTLIAALLAVLILVKLAEVGTSSLNIRTLNNQIEIAQQRHEDLENTLAAADSDVSVLTEAVKLNLVSSGGATTIQLTAPDAAWLTPVTEETADATLRASTVQGD